MLDVIDLFARRLAEQGSLAGISTIHTVRWAVLDEGKYLLLVSNYDGTWENYIDEFAELILSGLDAIWESSYGFPELGAQDLVAFKHFLRCHQVPGKCVLQRLPDRNSTNPRGRLKDGTRLGGTTMTQRNQLSPAAKADIQGFVTSGYGHLPFGAYLFLELRDRAQAHIWLQELARA